MLLKIVSLLSLIQAIVKQAHSLENRSKPHYVQKYIILLIIVKCKVALGS